MMNLNVVLFDVLEGQHLALTYAQHHRALVLLLLSSDHGIYEVGLKMIFLYSRGVTKSSVESFAFCISFTQP